MVRALRFDTCSSQWVVRERKEESKEGGSVGEEKGGGVGGIG